MTLLGRRILPSVILTAAALFVTRAALGQVVTTVTGERASDGSINVSGKTILPAGTRLRVTVANVVVFADVEPSGTFIARGFGNAGRPVTEVDIGVRVEAAFGLNDQSRKVLDKAGVGASKLLSPAGDLLADDVARPDGFRHLDVSMRVMIAPMSEGAFAKRQEAWRRDSLEFAGRPIVEAVKSATLALADGRKSDVSVKEAIHWHEWTGKFTPGVWSVQQPTPDEWIVLLSGVAKKSQLTARWSYNVATREVQALDSVAAELGYRRVPLLACVTEQEARGAQFPEQHAKYPPTIARLVVLPLPAPAGDKFYQLEAIYLIDAAGKPDLLQWNPPHDAAYAKKVANSLLQILFRPGLDYERKPACGRATLRVALGLPGPPQAVKR